MERKITPEDYNPIFKAVEQTIDRVKRSGRKAWFQYLDTDTVMSALYELDTVYLVDGYLVVYAIDRPWYAVDGVLFLEEILVLRVLPGGDFTVVPAFLERKAREAGCKLAVVGTALAKADAALASLYSRHGFNAEMTTLTKEP